MHETRARELLIITMNPGSIHPSEALEPIEIPDVSMPPPNTEWPDDSPPVVDVNKVLGATLQRSCRNSV